MKNKKTIKVIGIIFLIVSIILILVNTWELITLSSNEQVVILQKFHIDVSYYLKSQIIYYSANYFFYFPLLLFSIFTMQYKNLGRIGLSIVLSLSIVYFFLSPIIFDAKLPVVVIPGVNDNSENISTYIYYFVSIIKSVVLIFVLYFLNKKENQEIFKTT